MTAQLPHFGEELQDLLDGTLAEPRRSEVLAHVSQCASCRRELDALRWVKTEMVKHLDGAEMPPELPARVRAALDAADGKVRRPKMSRRVWITGGLLAAAALLIVIFPRRADEPSLAARVALDFREYDSGAVPLAIRSAEPQEIEAYFVRNGVTFPTRVFDLGMMQYQLVGGRVHRLDGRTSALFAYEGPGGTSLVCQMYEGSVAELPPTEDVRENDGITFYVHRMENITLVFWQEGDVVCVLASDAAPEDVVQLAFAKAVRVDSTGSG